MVGIEKMVGDKVVCDKVGVWQRCVKDSVCQRWWVEAAEEEAGYRIKNKNPTQRCGEITSVSVAPPLLSRSIWSKACTLQTLDVWRCHRNGSPSIQIWPFLGRRKIGIGVFGEFCKWAKTIHDFLVDFFVYLIGPPARDGAKSWGCEKKWGKT